MLRSLVVVMLVISYLLIGNTRVFANAFPREPSERSLEVLREAPVLKLSELLQKIDILRPTGLGNIHKSVFETRLEHAPTLRDANITLFRILSPVPEVIRNRYLPNIVSAIASALHTIAFTEVYLINSNAATRTFQFIREVRARYDFANDDLDHSITVPLEGIMPDAERIARDFDDPDFYYDVREVRQRLQEAYQAIVIYTLRTNRTVRTAFSNMGMEGTDLYHRIDTYHSFWGKSREAEDERDFGLFLDELLALPDWSTARNAPFSTENWLSNLGM